MRGRNAQVGNYGERKNSVVLVGGGGGVSSLRARKGQGSPEKYTLLRSRISGKG